MSWCICLDIINCCILMKISVCILNKTSVFVANLRLNKVNLDLVFKRGV